MFPGQNHRLRLSLSRPGLHEPQIQGSSRQPFEGSLATCPGTTTCKPSILTFHGFRIVFVGWPHDDKSGHVFYTTWDVSCTSDKRLKPCFDQLSKAQEVESTRCRKGTVREHKRNFSCNVSFPFSAECIPSTPCGPSGVQMGPSKEKPPRRSISLKVAQ